MNKDNLANGVILSASGTTITLRPGHGARLPAAPFFATAAPLGELMSKANSEIVQVTAIVGDVLTVVRAQRGTTQKTLADGWALGNGVYVEDLAAIDTKVNTKVTSTALTAALPATVGTANQILKVAAGGGSVTWQTDANTTYTEITDAEAANNASSTIRLITGRRLQKAITDAFTAVTGFIRSATTKRLTVSTTEPASPETGDVWINPTVGTGDNVLKDDGTYGKVSIDQTTFTGLNPYAKIDFADPGTGVIIGANAEINIPFNTLVFSGGGVTMPSNGRIRINRDGIYHISAGIANVDVPQAVVYKLAKFRVGSPTTLRSLTPWQRMVQLENNRGINISTIEVLEAGDEIVLRAANTSGSNTRVGANGNSNDEGSQYLAVMGFFKD